MRKLTLGPVFFDVVLECVLASIFVRNFEAPNLKNWALASTGARFLQNRRFRKRYEKAWFCSHFLEAEAKKIRLKIDSKMCCFKASHFKRFSFDFASILECQKSMQNPKFLIKIEVRRQLLKHYRFWAAFWTDFEVLGGWFWEIFEPPGSVFLIPPRICRNMRGSFQVAGLALMIRATRGRSIDR